MIANTIIPELSAYTLKDFVFLCFFSYIEYRDVRKWRENGIMRCCRPNSNPYHPQKHHSPECLGQRLWYISYMTISALISQPQPNANVCFYLNRNTIMTLSGRLRGLKGNTAVAVCAVDLSSFMWAIRFNSCYTSYTARTANRKPHNHKHLPSQLCCYSLTLCCTEASNRRLTHCIWSTNVLMDFFIFLSFNFLSFFLFDWIRGVEIIWKIGEHHIVLAYTWIMNIN